ncbi:MAG TPA: aspartate aminotransferase family protein, partial [Burkholderiaceae bacterium]|nr:aspartate aminotransferase family protein [Burkholderiaceae bacterium]
PAAYAHMVPLARTLAAGLRGLIAAHGLPWCVTQVGARVEFQFSTAPPRNGSEADRMLDSDLERLLHLCLLNRGVLITPFHNMMLVCPQTGADDVQRLLDAFDAALGEIVA